MAEDKAPDPMWTTEKVHAVAEKIFEEYAPHCKTELGLMFARDIATVIAQQFQLFEAFGGSGQTSGPLVWRRIPMGCLLCVSTSRNTRRAGLIHRYGKHQRVPRLRIAI